MKHSAIVLREPNSGCEASILPSFGFNCYRFTVPHGEADIDVLWSDDGIQHGTARASGSGIPILFPFPGRISGTTYRWQGQEYTLDAGDGRGNAIHGFVLDRPWRVIDQTANRLVGQFQASIDDPSLSQKWPADFRITVTYELSGYSLRCQLHVENPDTRDLPCGLGTHPYFRLPLGGTSADACVVRLPASSQWELKDMLPTGHKIPLPEAESLRAGRPFAGMTYDTVMSDLQFVNRNFTAEIFDPVSQMTLRQTFNDEFPNCVVYTPPHRQAVCIEPYSCVPGLTEPPSRDKNNMGLRLLRSGESFQTAVVIEIKKTMSGPD